MKRAGEIGTQTPFFTMDISATYLYSAGKRSLAPIFVAALLSAGHSIFVRASYASGVDLTHETGSWRFSEDFGSRRWAIRHFTSKTQSALRISEVFLFSEVARVNVPNGRTGSTSGLDR